MKKEQYEKVKAEAQRYIAAGKPLAAGHIHEQYAPLFTNKQYYELHDLIYKALKA